MTREADRLGIMVWSEVPVYWAEQFEKDPTVFAKSQQQLGMKRSAATGTRPPSSSGRSPTRLPDTAARTAFLTRSAEYVHQQDPHPTGHCGPAYPYGEGNNIKFIDDPLGKALDVIGFNEYIGWYEKTCRRRPTPTPRKLAPDLAYNKPLVVSEFGGGAKAGLHGAGNPDRWTEDYQAEHLPPSDPDAE